jgi:SAM-dependent methyltransferase
VIPVVGDELARLIAEQIAYYDARAAEYDETAPPPTADGYPGLVAALERFAPAGRVLEMAGGTGQWTAELAKRAARLTVIDTSAEMLALNKARVGRPDVVYVQADVFEWSPLERYDVVFFSAWLSHVPPQRFEDFWMLVRSCLDENGRVFVIDELPSVAAIEQTIADAPAPAVRRQLTTGETYRTVKVFYEPPELVERLAAVGFQAEVHPVSWRFFYAAATLAGTPG